MSHDPLTVGTTPYIVSHMKLSGVGPSRLENIYPGQYALIPHLLAFVRIRSVHPQESGVFPTAYDTPHSMRICALHSLLETTHNNHASVLRK